MGYIPRVLRLSDSYYMSLAKGCLPILPQTPLPAANQHFTNSIGAPKSVHTPCVHWYSWRGCCCGYPSWIPPTFSGLERRLSPRSAPSLGTLSLWYTEALNPSVRQLLMDLRVYVPGS